MPPIKSGMIVLWSGAIDEIPPGYWLCDGTHGTPDLRDRFIVGAGDSYNPNDSGGNVNHTHTFTSDGHHHTVQVNAHISFGSGFLDNTNSKTDSGTTDPTNHLPPYYALAFIMKA